MGCDGRGKLRPKLDVNLGVFGEGLEGCVASNDLVGIERYGLLGLSKKKGESFRL